MPIPIPTSPDDLGECIRALRKEGNTDSEQRVAICLKKYQESKEGMKEATKAEMNTMEDNEP
tara:strand:- start:4539 stop:4724 length:186 start_codon:yes stop_codon:yes gene_type:complete